MYYRSRLENILFSGFCLLVIAGIGLLSYIYYDNVIDPDTIEELQTKIERTEVKLIEVNLKLNAIGVEKSR